MVQKMDISKTFSIFVLESEKNCFPQRYIVLHNYLESVISAIHSFT